MRKKLNLLKSKLRYQSKLKSRKTLNYSSYCLATHLIKKLKFNRKPQYKSSCRSETQLINMIIRKSKRNVAKKRKKDGSRSDLRIEKASTS